jgi:hypothetical protein
MSLKYCCNHCDYTSALQHYVNHLIKKHKDEIYNEKTKHTINASLTGKVLPIFTIKIKDDNTKHHISICFGCNKFWERNNLATQHLQACQNKDKHIEVLKSLKFSETDTTKIENVSSEENDALKNEIVALKDKIAKLEKKVASTSNNDEITDNNVKAYDSLMTFFIEKRDEDFRDGLREELEEYNPDIDWTEHL